jgi:nicotinamidase-related amidase
MLGDKGHNLVSGLMEASFFHGVARGAQPGFEVKGTNPWVESYSVLGPEITELFNGTPVPRNATFVDKLLKFDVLIIAGEAKSHCVAWTIDDLLGDILQRDPELAKKVYLLEDCTSAVVVPGLDYTDDANAAFDRFRDAGMHVVQSTTPIEDWPDIRLA